MNVFVLLNTKEDILKNVGNRAVMDHSAGQNQPKVVNQTSFGALDQQNHL